MSIKRWGRIGMKLGSGRNMLGDGWGRW